MRLDLRLCFLLPLAALMIADAADALPHVRRVEAICAARRPSDGKAGVMDLFSGPELLLALYANGWSLPRATGSLQPAACRVGLEATSWRGAGSGG